MKNLLDYLKKAIPSEIFHRSVHHTTVLFAVCALVLGSIHYDIVNAQPSIFTDYNNSENQFPISNPREPVREFYVYATAYSSDPWQTDDTPCHPADWTYNLCENYEEHGLEDTIATNILPLGTKVVFPDLYGDRVFTVRDRMNSRYNGKRRIDFYKAELGENGKIDSNASRSEARNFGKKYIKMQIF